MTFDPTVYLFIKALHLIAVIAWMAGLLYLPRLFVYHADSAPGSDKSETFKIMERRLYKFIMNPAMILVWVFGLALLMSNTGLMQQGWIHAKLTLVILMTGLHHVFGAWRKKFDRDANTRSAKFYKIWNEAPTILMIAIIILAVLKPF